MWRVLQLDHKWFSYSLLLLWDVYDLRCNSVLDFFIFRTIFHEIHNVPKCDKHVNKDPRTVKCATLLLHTVGKTPSDRLHLSIHGHLSSPLSSWCILRIDTSFSMSYWDWFPGHRQQDRGSKEVQFREFIDQLLWLPGFLVMPCSQW